MNKNATRNWGAGTLVIIGGNTTPGGDALRAFTKAANGGPIVGFTTASMDVPGAAKSWHGYLCASGAKECTIPLVDAREHATDSKIIDLVSNCSGIFFGGGDQVKLVTVLAGTPLEDAIYEAWQRGAAVCGTSAGAAALSETTLAGNEVDEEGKLVEQYIGPGLGFLGFHTLIDTHFSERRRLYRLFMAIAGYPELMGLGIDEDTALVVDGEIGTVVGRGGVTFVDGRNMAYDNTKELTKGGQLTLSAMRVGIIGTGHSFNLREREIVEVLDRG